jgi:hypothetical protein
MMFAMKELKSSVGSYVGRAEMKGESRDIQPAKQAGQGKAPLKPGQLFEAEEFQRHPTSDCLQNLDLFREVQRLVPRRHAHQMGQYLIEVLAEAVNSSCWRKIIGEAHRRVLLYYPEELKK